MTLKKITAFSLLLLLLFPLTSLKPIPNYGSDFLEFWTDVHDNYAYFDKKHCDWDKVKTVYLPLAEKAHTENELITLMEQALEELYDNHFSLNTNLKSSTRLAPTGLDLWAEWVDGKAVVTEVRKGFSADKVGIRCGMEISSINGIPVEEAVKKRIGKCITNTDTEVKNYALRQLLAGTYLQERVLGVKQGDKTNTVNLDKAAGNLTDKQQHATLLDSRILDQNIGYIRVNNSLGETDLIPLFDKALEQLRNTTALVIDLRDTPSGGNSIVARGIMSRFIQTEMPYQKHVLPNEEKLSGIKRSWLELVSPRGPFTYVKPVVILVDHWTGSMGEGITVGFDALGRATTVGTRMAGLNGAINGFSTTQAKIPYSFPTEQLYHINGTAREQYTPTKLVDLNNTSYNGMDDPILTEGLKAIKH